MSDSHGEHGDGVQTPKSFWTKYVFSTNHKVIGIQFMFVAMLFVIIEGLLALGLRSELARPKQHTPHGILLPGGTLPETAQGPRMTSTAPESNLALWKVDGHVQMPRQLNLNVAVLDVAARRTVATSTARLRAAGGDIRSTASRVARC
jgi:hypothetical protein